MRRREFITLLGDAAAAWQLPLAAQQERIRRIGVLIVNAESDPEGQACAAALRQDLQELGWTEGRNIRTDYRWGAGEPDRARAHAAELGALALDVILAHGTPASTATQRATRSIPVVFVVVEPVGGDLVQSLAQPRGNIG
jgi:putative ABC transport system substrate-binding protein